MVVKQLIKNKVRPVLDFRELSQIVECHTGADAIDNCDENLRECGQMYKLFTLNLFTYNLEFLKICGNINWLIIRKNILVKDCL